MIIVVPCDFGQRLYPSFIKVSPPDVRHGAYGISANKIRRRRGIFPGVAQHHGHAGYFWGGCAQLPAFPDSWRLLSRRRGGFSNPCNGASFRGGPVHSRRLSMAVDRVCGSASASPRFGRPARRSGSPADAPAELWSGHRYSLGDAGASEPAIQRAGCSSRGSTRSAGYTETSGDNGRLSPNVLCRPMI